MKKRILILLIFIVNILLVGGCSRGKKVPEGPYEIPDWVLEKMEGEKKEEDLGVSIDFYFDNTMTTKGFILDKSGKKDKNASPEYISFMRSTRDILKTYSESNFYTLQKDDNQELDWKKTNLDDAFERYNTNWFYKEGKQQAGSLYYQEFKNDENINVIVTDLTEVNVSSMELSNRLNQTLLAKPGYGVYMLAFRFPYNGYGYFTKDTEVVQENISVDKPLYVIAAGKADVLDEFIHEYCKKLKQQGMEEGSDYYTISYIPGDPVEQVEPEDILTQLGIGEKNGMVKKPEWQENNWNIDLSVKKIDEYHINEVFKTTDKLSLFAYQFEKKDKAGSRRLLINYFIPLNIEEQELENLSYIIVTDKQKSSNEKIQAIYDQWDCMKYSYLTAKENETDETGKEDANGYEWKNLEPIEFNKEIKINADIIKKGEKIFDLIETEETSERLKKNYEKTELKVADTNYLRVQVEGIQMPAELSGETVVFNIPIYLYIERNIKIPEWIEEFSTDKEKDYMHTKNLDLFCSDLFRLDLGDDKELYKTENYKKLTDIVTAITTLPIGESSK